MSSACAMSLTSHVPPHFTGKERDAENGNDYFGARYFASTMGRFLSPDWSAKAEPVPYAKLDWSAPIFRIQIILS
jgi:RHS repeat-associated protein